MVTIPVLRWLHVNRLITLDSDPEERGRVQRIPIRNRCNKFTQNFPQIHMYRSPDGEDSIHQSCGKAAGEAIQGGSMFSFRRGKSARVSVRAALLAGATVAV